MAVHGKSRRITSDELKSNNRVGYSPLETKSIMLIVQVLVYFSVDFFKPLKFKRTNFVSSYILAFRRTNRANGFALYILPFLFC